MKDKNKEEGLTYEPLEMEVDLREIYLLGYLKGRYQEEIKENYEQLFNNQAGDFSHWKV
jgi:uncharacterized protein YnzC (UPF0291/DUF896 family)